MKANTIQGQRLLKGLNGIASEYAVDYLSNWTFNHPAVITENTYLLMQRIQKYLYKLIVYFGTHYDEYQNKMPIHERSEQIIKLCNNKLYNPGSYRTDFVITTDNKIKLIEITCRFALNGLFLSGFFNYMTDSYLQLWPYIKRIDAYSPLFDYLMELFGNFNHICLLKGHFDNNESKYAVPIFEKAGFKVHVLKASNIPSNTHLFKNSVIISELNQSDWFQLPDNIILQIINSNLINDLRTIFLIHDKRFFSFLSDYNFLLKILSKEEADELINSITITYRPNQMPELWESARQNKNNWILKPFDKGRSIDVFAGCITEQKTWDELFFENKTDGMILQPFIQQNKFKGSIKDSLFEDYITGIMLFLNDNFFGPGMFRTSSCPVTNKIDDRKMFPLISNDITDSEKYLIF